MILNDFEAGFEAKGGGEPLKAFTKTLRPPSQRFKLRSCQDL